MKSLQEELLTDLRGVGHRDGRLRVRAGTRACSSATARTTLCPCIVQRLKGASTQGEERALGEGQEQAVGRQILERRLLLQEHWFFNKCRRRVLHRTQPEEALNDIGLRRKEDQGGKEPGSRNRQASELPR